MTTAADLVDLGVRDEHRAAGYLRNLGYWVQPSGQGHYPPRVAALVRGSRSTLRWFPDLSVGVPGDPNSTRLVDVKTRVPNRVGGDVSVEIAPLMLGISGVLARPVLFMYGTRWAPATRVWDAVLPTNSHHCCETHYRWAVCASPDDVDACLAVIRRLPEKCRPTNGSADPYVWVAPSCFDAIRPARRTR